MQPVPPGEKLEWQANLITQALDGHGLLVREQVAGAESIDAVARWLAEQSRHLRYVGIADGWRQLLDSDVLIDHAHAAALKAHPRPDRDYEQALSRARDALLQNVTVRRAAGIEG
jgi:hypothetical protein